MARAPKWTAPKNDPHSALEPCAPALTLSPAELEALLQRLCCCGTRRATSAVRRLPAAPHRAARACARRSPDEWCRVGERATAAGPRAETRFG